MLFSFTWKTIRCLWEPKLWILKSLSISCARCCLFSLNLSFFYYFLRHTLDLAVEPRCRSLTAEKQSGAGGLPRLPSEAAMNWPPLSQNVIENVGSIYFSTRNKKQKKDHWCSWTDPPKVFKKTATTNATLLLIDEDWRQDNRLWCNHDVKGWTFMWHLVGLVGLCYFYRYDGVWPVTAASRTSYSADKKNH